MSRSLLDSRSNIAFQGSRNGGAALSVAAP